MSERTRKVKPVEDAQATLRLLRGETADASFIPDESVRQDPTAIPSIRWDCDGTFLGEAFGSLGECYEDRIKGRTPAQAYDAGFIAARLALKEGLIE